jgi:arsenate reductase (glutaredoxin)
MPVTLYGIPNCDTVKKARAWLDANGINYSFHDFKKAGVSTDFLEDCLAKLGWETLINRKGTTWRNLSEDQKASAADTQSALALMLESPSVIKRPVLSVEGRIHVGFAIENYQQIFEK